MTVLNQHLLSAAPPTFAWIPIVPEKQSFHQLFLGLTIGIKTVKIVCVRFFGRRMRSVSSLV